MATACRHLWIKFHESGDVSYRFMRHYDEPLHRYLIEWPAESTEITNECEIKVRNYRRSTTATGFVLLEWDRDPDGEQGFVGINYIKHGYLTHPNKEPGLWRYQERFIIKPAFFGLQLHSPHEHLNAIQRRSSASFCDQMGVERAYTSRQLANAVFQEPGVLTVDWMIEVLEQSVRLWPHDLRPAD